MYKYICFLAASGLLLCACAALAQDADTVDGFHAYGTPHANALLALNGSARMSGTVIANDSIPGSRLVPGAVTAGRLGSNSVTTDKISDGQVMEADLAAGSVTSSKIANDSVSYVKITNGTVRGEDMYVPLSMSGSPLGGVISATNTRSYFFGKTTPKGLYGSASGSGTVYGVYGTASGSGGRGVYGYTSSTTGSTVGVYGYAKSSLGKAVYGYNSATSGSPYGVYGSCSDYSGYSVYGKNLNTGNYGYLARSSYGVVGVSYVTNGTGVYGYCNTGSSAAGVWGVSSSGDAGYFTGDVWVQGTLDATDKQFKIDHPLDPENMYLHHACVESSDRTNIYNGNVVLDARGEAWVSLPDWFEALNCDFRYQLTPIGGPGPNLHIAQEIQDGYFRVAGGLPGMKVSWLVTGIRQDPYAAAHPLEVEVEKPDIERGYYLHPDVYGMPETRGVEWAIRPQEMQEMYENSQERQPPEQPE